MIVLRLRPAAAAVAACALAALAACSDPEPPREPLLVNARSGARVDLSRTAWSACRPPTFTSGASERWTETHGERGAVTYTVTPYPDVGCAGAAGAGESVAGIAYAQGERTVGFTGAPPDGLGASVVATRVYVDAGAVYSLDCYWLDDTVSPRVLYTGDPNATADAEGYPNTFFEGGAEEL
ncbi:MAG TPA: hypothetical protein VFL83_07030 [Anaeromyxobacter sp.]|nr:hypothetical protein [Anaeromyxobacter sp.]